MRILLFTLVMTTCFSMAAWAGEWQFYGSARVATFTVDTDNPGATDSENFNMGLQGNSRIGTNVTASDALNGTFEFGASGGSVNVRNLYGQWNFGPGELLVGQTYTPLNWFYSNQVYDADNDLNGQGFIYSGRKPILMLTFDKCKIALVNPNTDDLGTGFTSEADHPAIEASFNHTINGITLELAGGYNSYELINGAATYDIDSYVLAAGARYAFGRAFLNGAVFKGKNAGHLIAVSVDGDNAWDDGFAAISGNRVLDNDVIGYALVAGCKINDMFTFEAGYGYTETDLETAAFEDKVQVYYANITVNLAPGVFFVPEIGRFDGEESEDTVTTYYGAKWQINF